MKESKFYWFVMINYFFFLIYIAFNEEKNVLILVLIGIILGGIMGWYVKEEDLEKAETPTKKK